MYVPSIALTTFGSGGLAVASWLNYSVVPFNVSTSGWLSSLTLGSSVYSNTSYAYPPSLSNVVTNGSGSIYALSYVGELWYITSGGTVTYTTLCPSGRVYTGLVFCSGNPYALDSSGNIWTKNPSTSGYVSVGSYSATSFQFCSSGNTLVTCTPSNIKYATLSTSAAIGAVNTISYPATITNPNSLFVVSGQPLALGGYINAPSLSGAITASINPFSNNIVAVAGSGLVGVISSSGSINQYTWSQLSYHSGYAVSNGVVWSANGLQVLTAGSASGAVQIFNYILGALVFSQTISGLTGASSIDVTPDNAYALVTLTNSVQLLYNNSGTWATSGTAITGITSARSINVLNSTGAVVGYASGIAYLANTGSWGLQSLVNLGYPVSYVTVDQSNNIYAVGYTSGSGIINVVTGSTVISSGNWIGNQATSIAIVEGRFIVATPADSMFRVFDIQTFTQQFSGSITNTNTFLQPASGSLLVCNSGATNIYSYTTQPSALNAFSIQPAQTGVVAFWNGSSWTSTTLGNGLIPSDIGYDLSGKLWVVTPANAWFSVSGSTILSSGVFSSGVITYPSSITVTSGNMVFCSSAADGNIVRLQ